MTHKLSCWMNQIYVAHSISIFRSSIDAALHVSSFLERLINEEII